METLNTTPSSFDTFYDSRERGLQVFEDLLWGLGDCTNFDVKGADWFKIDADGYSAGLWASAKLISSKSLFAINHRSLKG